MTDELKTIRLYGKLGNRFGRVHKFVCADTKGAIRALCAMVPGFQKALMESKDKGVAYACFIGRRSITEDQLGRLADDDIRIAPIVMGSGRGGFFSFILGAALVGAAFFTGGASIAAWSALQLGMGVLGAAMMLTGMSSVLVKQPKGLTGVESDENKASYNFNGVVNAVAQGNPVPVCYGEMVVGSVVGGGDMYAIDLAV